MSYGQFIPIFGPPGVGKSQIVKEIAKKDGLKIKEIKFPKALKKLLSGKRLKKKDWKKLRKMNGDFKGLPVVPPQT